VARAKRPPTRRVKSGKSGHRYIVDGHNYSGRGVTTLIGDGVPKPALIGWAARVVAQAAVDEIHVWWPMVKRGAERAAVEYLKEQRWKSSNEAALRGTDVHVLAARLAAGETVEVDDRTEALAVREDFRPTAELSEVMVVNRTHVYAGTFDLWAELEGYLWVPEHSMSLDEAEKAGLVTEATSTRPARMLIDYKTGATGIYPEVVLQLAAYRNAEIILPGLEGGPLDELPMPECDACAVLWLRDDATYELRLVDVSERAFKVFLYAAQIAKFAGRDGWGQDALLEALAPNVEPEPEPETAPEQDDQEVTA
jgi:hypothetical protein